MRKLRFVIPVALLLSVSACSDLLNLDLLDNPNEVTPDIVQPELLYNQIQLSFVDFFHAMHDITDGVMRMTSMEAFSYQEALPSTVGNRAWRIAYAELFPDISLLVSLDDESRLSFFQGSARVLQSYVLTTLVDFFGDVPLDRAGMGIDVPSPGASEGQGVYLHAEKLLDEAIGLLMHSGDAMPGLDNFYNGNASRWMTLARTLKLRLYHNTRLVNASARDKINALLAEGDLIDQPEEDFAFDWSAHRTNPDARHPAYKEMYERSMQTYLGHYFMWTVTLEKGGGATWCLDGIEDPRRRFYFYRQSYRSAAAKEAVSCFFPFDELPEHYAAVDTNLPFCVMDYGYFGRDHGNGQGIPPDDQFRTAYGVYPFGGKWDDHSFQSTLNQGADGARGAGISPILLSGFVHMMRAEAALTLGTSDDAQKQFDLGVRASIDKVISFQDRIPAQQLNATLCCFEWGCTTPLDCYGIAREFLIPSEEDVLAYLHAVNRHFLEDPLETTMKEFYIALWGNSIEAYNMYRRTGMPANMQPGMDADVIGSFPRSLLYPTDHVTLNANAQQKSLQDLVFWDDGSANVR